VVTDQEVAADLVGARCLLQARSPAQGRPVWQERARLVADRTEEDRDLIDPGIEGLGEGGAG
jgi:hypothetical protein